MKKLTSSLALLALAAGAQAQSSVTLSGVVKGGLAQTRYSNGPAGTNGSNTGVADGVSRFIISGREDLGGGLHAVFQSDTRWRVDDNGTAPAASPLSTGTTFLGLAGRFGQVRIGKIDQHYCLGSDEHGSRATAVQASSCGVLGYVGGIANPIAVVGRSVNLVRYDIPATWLTGLSGGFGYSSNPFGNDGVIGDGGKGRALTANVGYTSGPLAIGTSWWTARSEDRTIAVARTDQDAWAVTGSWNFGFAKVGLVYDHAALDRALAGAAVFTETERRAWSIPTTIPVGLGTVILTYTRAQELKTGGATVAGSGARMWTIGYDYPLSRRSSIGVSYANLNNGATASYGLFTSTLLQNLPAPVGGQDVRQFYVGMRHNF